MAFAEPLEHDVTSVRKRIFLTVGPGHSHFLLRVRERCAVTTEGHRLDVLAETNYIFVATATDSIEVT